MKTVFSKLLFICFIVAVNASPAASQSKPVPKIIFDTDMGPDYDDIGAITILHNLALKGECEILATVASDGHATIAPTIDLFNTFFKRPDIPVGLAGNGAPGFPAGNNWNDAVLKQFGAGNFEKKQYAAAVAIYREVLSKQKDQTVTIVTVGFLTNIRDLLNSKPDKFSPLNGLELVRKKVKNWVAMAGAFPEGSEFNLNQHGDAAYEAISKWPGQIVFSGFEIGNKIFTGGKVAKTNGQDNPIAWAYAYNLKTYTGKPEANRESWDQTAVLCAIRNPVKYFYVNGPGKMIIHTNGSNSWDPDVNARHYFLSHKYPYQKIADILDDLMIPGK